MLTTTVRIEYQSLSEVARILKSICLAACDYRGVQKIIVRFGLRSSFQHCNEVKVKDRSAIESLNRSTFEEFLPPLPRPCDLDRPHLGHSSRSPMNVILVGSVLKGL